MATNKKAGSSNRMPARKNTSSRDDDSGSSATAQRARLLEALSRRAVTTLDARQELDVLHPAARVQELRQTGHRISTVWIVQLTASGAPHRVAKYVLLPSLRRRAKRGAA
jgi:hypothetical protein